VVERSDKGATVALGILKGSTSSHREQRRRDPTSEGLVYEDSVCRDPVYGSGRSKRPSVVRADKLLLAVSWM